MCPMKAHTDQRQELRQFGVGLGLLLSVAGIVLLWRGRTLGWGLCLLAPLATPRGRASGGIRRVI